MKNLCERRNLRRRLLLGTTGVAALVCTAANAQESDADDTIIVTGSRIVEGNLVSPSPVTSIGAEEFDARGVLRVEDLLNTLPQVSPSEGAGRANEATGTATVDLRGLGPERTLVLVNGRRLPFGSPTFAPPDINQIPSQLVERVDVLTGGASAVYGADAVAGVVNFIMQDDFEGLEIDIQGSAFQTANSDDNLERVLNDFDQPVPGSTFDGESVNLNVIFGLNSPDGRGNLTSYFNYRRQSEVLQGDRITSACALGTRDGGNDFACVGSGTTFPTHFVEGTALDVIIDETTGDLRQFQSPEDTFNFAPLNHLLRPDERYNFGAYGRYEINDSAEFYVDASYSDVTTTAQIAPSGNFGQRTFNCDSPFLNDSLLQTLCLDRGVDPAAADPADRLTTLTIQRRNVEGGGRQNRIQHTTFRINGGFRGDINETWSYDVFGQYGQVTYSDVSANFINGNNVANALIVREDPETGEPVCQSVLDGTDPNCVPWNIFELGGVTQGALDYIQAPGFRTGDADQMIFGGYVNGDLGDYGLKFPWAETGVQAVFGAEYRDEYLVQENDFLTESGALGSARPDIAGGIKVYEFYTEMQIPIVQGAPFADDLSITGAYRFSDFYETTGTQSTYAGGISWAPTPSYRIRAQYQRATRSPNPFELFATQDQFEFELPTLPNGNSDPCAGTTPFASFEQCANTGVTAAQYGNIANNPANQYTNLSGGNEDLEVEKSDTFTVGLVATPDFIPGLTFSVDYFNIEVEDFIATVPEALTINNCLETGDEFFCSLINRDPSTGSLFLGNDGFVVATTVNTGSLKTTGIDFSASYRFEVGGFGDVRVDYLSTYLRSVEKVPLPGEEAFDCAGKYSSTNAECGVAQPVYRHRLPVTWSAANADISATLTWRYFGSADLLSDNPAPVAATLDSVNYIDLSVRGAISENVEMRAGVNNLFDVTAPVSSSIGGSGGSFGNGNVFPSAYDALGRFLFVGATFRL